MSTEILKLVDGDVTREARQKAKPRHVEVKNFVFKVDYKIDTKLADQMDTDAEFVSTMREDLMDLYEKLVAEFAARWAQADHVASKEPLSKFEMDDFLGDLSKLFEKYRKSIKDKADGHVKKWLQIRDDRAKYTREVGFNIAVGSISVLAGGASAISGAATMGVSFVTAWISIVKGLAKLWLEYKRIAADVDKAHAKVTETIKGLLDAYKDSSDAGVGGRELAKSALADFFVVQMATIKRADTEFVTYKGKVAPLHTQTAELGRQLNHLLDEQKKLDHKIAVEFAAAMKKANRRSAKFDELLGTLERSRAEVQRLIKGIEDMHLILVKHEDFKKALDADLADLHARKPTWAKRLEWVSKAVSIAVSPTVTTIATHGDNLRKIAETMESCYDLVKEEVGA